MLIYEIMIPQVRYAELLLVYWESEATWVATIDCRAPDWQTG